MLHIGGTATGRWLGRVRDVVTEEVPQAEDVEVLDAHHSLAVSHPGQVAEAVHALVHRHPV